MEKHRKNAEIQLKFFEYYLNLIDEKFLKHVRILDIQITRNFRDASIETRPVQSNGLWCCFLLPTILVVYSKLYPLSQLYKLTAFLSVGLLCYSLLFIIFVSISCLVLRDPIYGGCVAAAVVSAILIYSFTDHGLPCALSLSSFVVYFYSLLLRKSLTLCPKTFTIGEAMVVVQSISLFCAIMLSKLIFVHEETDEEMHLINTVVFTVLSTVGLIVTALYNLMDQERTLETLACIIGAATVFTLIVLHVILGPSCVLQILRYIFRDELRVQLFCFWLSLLILTIVCLVFRTRMGVKARSGTRKCFHVLAALVFTPGLMLDVELMALAAGLAVPLIILVEALRKSRIKPVSSALQNAFDIYSDEKDCGTFAMTPIYLLAGLASPLALVPWRDSQTLLAGVLSVGVGDTAASWFGERYGCVKWPGGNRTFEGTAFNIAAQIVTLYILEAFELLQTHHAIIRGTVAATASALVEARTDQVDNLVLPLVSIIAFQATTFLS